MSARYRKSVTPRQSADKFLSLPQMIILLVMVALGVTAITLWPVIALQSVLGLILGFSALFFFVKIITHQASKSYVYLGRQPVSIDDPDLPTITALIPLYKEAEMLPTVVASMEGLRYPKDRFQALLILEDNDTDTRLAVMEMKLPDYFEIVVVPNQLPKGKPKALNVGFARATGVISVIFDAEDHPDPDQLLKAVAGFREAPMNVACLQAALDFTNQETNWRTRFYWTEYIVHFARVLPGLAKLNLIPPLGGTSNYFQTAVLRQIAFDSENLPKGSIGLPAWDAWNVTEDAELAGALSARGYRIMMIDSHTDEAAASGAINAYKQRKRWLKGYLQTALVYTRHPIEMIRQMGFVRWFVYILMMLGTPSSLLLNPLTWGLTIAYFVTRATYSPAALFIQSLFPAPLFYTGVLLMLVGNAFLFFQLVGACFEREGYSTLKYLLLAPLWWAFTSWSAYGVLLELARPSTRHAWNKTDHSKELLQQEEAQKKKKTEVDSDLEQILDIV